MRQWMQILAGSLVIGMLAGMTAARNVDLSTVPKRDSVQLTIYNSEDLTLVRETRTVTFKKGNNPLQFSWANTRIDPTSVRLQFLTKPEQLDMLDTTFPHDKPGMLYWNVKSDFDGEATIQISYFTAGITWSADYSLIAAADESKLNMEGFVRVFNNSGEEYEDASVRLVVGKINLVEKMAQLARMPVSDLSGLSKNELGQLKLDAANTYTGGTNITAGTLVIGSGSALSVSGYVEAKPKEIIKEGLSEYFIFSIEGTETIQNGWSKRMRSAESKEVPVKIEYRYRPNEYGDQLVRMYILTNDDKNKLGKSPLPDGVWRTFRDNGRGGLSYLTQQTLKYIPVGDKIELNLGKDPEVIFELVKQKSYRDNIWLRFGGANLDQRVDDGAARVNVNASVVGWDQHTQYAQRIRNYTSKPIEVEVRRAFGGDVDFIADLANLKLYDYQTPEFKVPVAANEKKDFSFEAVVHNGRNVKQNRVTLVAPK